MKQLEELRATAEGTVRYVVHEMFAFGHFRKFRFQLFSELEQIQNEKRKSLLEHETVKLRECDDALQRDLREWKSKLLPRKQVI